MKVVIAIDSLKGSLSSMDAGNAIKDGILKAVDAEVIVKPLADGGEGTTDALIEGMGGERISLTVKGPLEAPVDAYYGYLEEATRPSWKWLLLPHHFNSKGSLKSDESDDLWRR